MYSLVLKKSSDDHNAYENQSSKSSEKKILKKFDTCRNHLAFCDIIDTTLALPRDACKWRDHQLCNHAKIVYDEDHHQEDLVKGNTIQ